MMQQKHCFSLKVAYTYVNKFVASNPAAVLVGSEQIRRIDLSRAASVRPDRQGGRVFPFPSASGGCSGSRLADRRSTGGKSVSSRMLAQRAAAAWAISIAALAWLGICKNAVNIPAS